MFKIPRDNQWPPAIDLRTVRETLMYMRDDMGRVPGLEKASEALDKAITEIDKAQASAAPRARITPTMARFLPRSYFTGN